MLVKITAYRTLELKIEVVGETLEEIKEKASTMIAGTMSSDFDVISTEEYEISEDQEQGIEAETIYII